MPPDFPQSPRRYAAEDAPRTGGGVSATGRTPPHSSEAEESLLACCMIDGGDSITACLEAKLAPEAFYGPANRVIFEVLCDLYRAGNPVDEAVLAEELRKRGLLDGVGGLVRLNQLTDRIPTTAHRTYFLEQVRENALLRQLIAVATGAIERCYEYQGGIEEFIDKVERDMFQVTQDRTSDSAREMKEPIKEATAVIAKMLERRGEMTGVSSGLVDVDKMLFGFQKQEMIILAARPSMGKTSLALNFAEAAALPPNKKYPPVGVLLFSLEMGSSQIALRMLCSHARVNMQRLRDGFVGRDSEDTSRLGRSAEALKASPILVDDSSNLSIMEMRAKARRVAQRLRDRGGLGMIIVDYLQLVSGTDPKANREQQVAEISRGMKAMAKELHVPVIVLSQLNRASEKENRVPRLSDLRESGSIEQDADVVLMLARPKEADEKFQTAADSADLIVAKQRNGPVGEIKLTFLRDITRFENHIS
ncbi:MAG: replicative DNA helicase [Opitutaceae bacterium]|nr:replicative DNA helicase [Opitutaceae bacterium]